MSPVSNYRNRNEGRVIFGLIVAGFGIILLLQTLGLLPSVWYTLHYSWPIVLIIVGVLIGARSRFQNNAWWILIIIGIANLTPVFYIGDVSSRRLLWPGVLILAGLAIVLRNKKKGRDWDGTGTSLVTTSESTVNIDVTFGGRKEIVTSKDFRGGRISTTFGGAEVNLMQADSPVQPMVMDIRVSFGSVELVIPSYWELINEIDPTFGSVEDHRMVRTPDAATEKRTLILRGSCSFGSIELKSY